MAFDFKQKLLTPQEIRELYPVPAHVAQIKKERDEEIRKIFTGESDRFIAKMCIRDSSYLLRGFSGQNHFSLGDSGSGSQFQTSGFSPGSHDSSGLLAFL